MAETAAHLVDHVFPRVPVRQWVLTLPFDLRARVAFDPKLRQVVLRTTIRAIFAWLRRRARSKGVVEPRCESVTFEQRFSSDLRLNLHFHVLALDGVFSESGAEPIFHEVGAPTEEELNHLAKKIHFKIAAFAIDGGQPDVGVKSVSALPVVVGNLCPKRQWTQLPSETRHTLPPAGLAEVLPVHKCFGGTGSLKDEPQQDPGGSKGQQNRVPVDQHLELPVHLCTSDGKDRLGRSHAGEGLDYPGRRTCDQADQVALLVSFASALAKNLANAILQEFGENFTLADDKVVRAGLKGAGDMDVPGMQFREKTMAKARQKEQIFDFENAVVGQPGPDGCSPILRTFVTNGIPGVETRPEGGLRTITVPLAALRRRPMTRITPPPPRPVLERQPARVARMLALANDLQDKLDRGEHKDQATLARELGLTPTRVTRLLDLALLAPDIQEKVLFLEAVDGKEPVTERALRAVVRHMNWTEQRRVWRELRPS